MLLKVLRDPKRVRVLKVLRDKAHTPTHMHKQERKLTVTIITIIIITMKIIIIIIKHKAIK